MITIISYIVKDRAEILPPDDMILSDTQFQDTVHLPADILLEIQKQYCAMRLQFAVRVFMFRHTKSHIWKELRTCLCQYCDSTADIDKLSQNEMVRSEWRTDAQSWLFALQSERFDTKYKRDHIQKILAEIKIGTLWKFHR